MKCPECGSKTIVVDTRCNSDAIFRRRECRKCDNKFTTIEKIFSKKMSVYKAKGVQIDLISKSAVKVCLNKIINGFSELQNICREEDIEVEE